jgi:hypothetical protein
MVMFEAAVLRLMPVPAARETLEDEPLSEKLVAIGTDGPEIVMA